MIEFVKGDLFESDCDVFVNTVNCAGAMGKGIAKEFKRFYPEMFKEYKLLCDSNQIRPGSVHLWRNPSNNPKWILNFPTKDHWKGDSKKEYIIEGLRALKSKIVENKIKSIAIPALGCGNGDLDWNEVKVWIEDILLHEQEENTAVDRCRIVIFAPRG